MNSCLDFWSPQNQYIFQMALRKIRGGVLGRKSYSKKRCSQIIMFRTLIWKISTSLVALKLNYPIKFHSKQLQPWVTVFLINKLTWRYISRSRYISKRNSLKSNHNHCWLIIHIKNLVWWVSSDQTPPMTWKQFFSPFF